MHAYIDANKIPNSSSRHDLHQIRAVNIRHEAHHSSNEQRFGSDVVGEMHTRRNPVENFLDVALAVFPEGFERYVTSQVAHQRQVLHEGARISDERFRRVIAYELTPLEISSFLQNLESRVNFSQMPTDQFQLV